MISSAVITGGSFVTQNSYQIHSVKSGFDRLQEAVATGAFHDSDERATPPNSLSESTTAVGNKIMEWVTGQDSETQDGSIMWLHGAAGTGKSTLAQRIAEFYYAQKLLIASFFFGRSDPYRNHARSLFPTIAYQMALAIPQLRDRLVAIIEHDPLILSRSLSAQFLSLIITPLEELVRSGEFNCPSSRWLIVIDGLDECLDRTAQIAVLDIILKGIGEHRLPVAFLVTSRPEREISDKFDSTEMSSILTRLTLGISYLPGPKLLLNNNKEENPTGKSKIESQAQEGPASGEFCVYPTITHQHRYDEHSGMRWLSVTRGECLYTNGVISGEVDMQGDIRKCFTVRNKAGTVGFIRIGLVVFQNLEDDFLPHMDKKCRSLVTLGYGSIPFSKWLPVTKDELLSTEGVVRIEDGVNGGKVSCYQVANQAGRIGFIDASKIMFEDEDQEPTLDKKIRSNVTHDYSVNPRSLWIPIQKGEILYTDGRSRIEVGLDGEALSISVSKQLKEPDLRQEVSVLQSA